MKRYPAVCDDVAYNVNGDEKVARVNDLLDTSEEVRHLSVALDDKQRGTDCKLKVLLTSHFYSICHINSEWRVRSQVASAMGQEMKSYRNPAQGSHPNITDCRKRFSRIDDSIVSGA